MDEVGKALNQALRSNGAPVLAGGYRKKYLRATSRMIALTSA